MRFGFTIKTYEDLYSATGLSIMAKGKDNGDDVFLIALSR